MNVRGLIGSNYGVFSALPSSTVHRLLVPVSSGAYVMSLLVLAAALCGVLPDLPYWLRASILLWLCGNTWRRAVPVLWAERGKMTYLPVTRDMYDATDAGNPSGVAVQTNALLAQRERTLQWWSRCFQTVWDGALLSLAAIAVAFRNSRGGVSVALAWVLPRSVHSGLKSSAPFYVAFWILPLTNVAVSLALYAFAFSMYRMKPTDFSRPRRALLLKVSACAVACLSVPSLLVSMAPFSCTTLDEVQVMTFAPATRCGAASHKAHCIVACVFLALGALVTEMAMGSVQLLQGPGPITAKILFRSAKHCDEALLALKWLLVFVFVLGPVSQRSALAVSTALCALAVAVVMHWPVTNEKFLLTMRTAMLCLVLCTNALLLFVFLLPSSAVP